MKPMILNTETTQRVELIDKNKALELLKKNTQNFRKLDKRKVFKYAREMKEGRWQFNGEAIQFYKNGVLANGQHRLWAVVYADVTIPFLVVEGIDNSVTTIDVGSKRTISQLARANGYTMSTQKSSAISLILHGYSEKAEDKQTGETEILDFYAPANIP